MIFIRSLSLKGTGQYLPLFGTQHTTQNFLSLISHLITFLANHNAENDSLSQNLKFKIFNNSHPYLLYRFITIHDYPQKLNFTCNEILKPQDSPAPITE